MQDAGIAAGGDDAAIGRHLRPTLAEFVVQFGFQVIFEQAGATRLHGTDMSARTDLGSFLHHLHFGRRFVQAHVVQQVVEGDEFVWRHSALARLGADVVDPLHQPMIELLIAADGVVDALAAFDQPRQDVVDIANGEGIVGAKLADRTVLAGTQAIPQLALGITLATEQHIFTVLAPRDQRHHRFRLGKTGEVLEIAVLTVDMLDVTVADIHRRRRQNGDAVGFHLRHQRLAPTGIFGLGDADQGRLRRKISAGRVWQQAPQVWRTR